MEAELMFLGLESRTSKTKGNKYFLARFDAPEAGSIQFYLSSDDVKQEVGALKPYTPCKAKFKLKAFNGRPELELIGVAPTK
jgi:hypothetical protein